MKLHFSSETPRCPHPGHGQEWDAPLRSLVGDTPPSGSGHLARGKAGFVTVSSTESRL